MLSVLTTGLCTADAIHTMGSEKWKNDESLVIRKAECFWVHWSDGKYMFPSVKYSTDVSSAKWMEGVELETS